MNEKFLHLSCRCLIDLPWVEKYQLNLCCKSFHVLGNVNESCHSLAKWLRVCLKLAGLLTGGILFVSIQSLALKRWASGLSPGRPLKIGGGILTQGGGSARPPGPRASSPATTACIAGTICANKAASAGGGPNGPGGPAGPIDPMGPAGSGRGGGGGGRGTGPPPGPPPPPPGGTGVAISNTQCNGKLNLTSFIDNGLIYLLYKCPGHLHTLECL